jgi:hypothetical protein
MFRMEILLDNYVSERIFLLFRGDMFMGDPCF